MYSGRQCVRQSLQAGAAGHVLKDATSREIIAAIKALAVGGRYYSEALAEALTGYTVDAINSKIKRGDWLEGAVFFKAPDGRNLIGLEGYEEWVMHGKAASGQLHRAASQ